MPQQSSAHAMAVLEARRAACSLLAAAALAVGIGATTAIYTVVNAVMLQTPRLRRTAIASVNSSVHRSDEPEARSSLSFAGRRRSTRLRRQSFDVFGWFRPETYTLTSPGAPQHVQGAAVTPSLAQNLGVQPALGRWFVDDTRRGHLEQSLAAASAATPAILGSATSSSTAAPSRSPASCRRGSGSRRSATPATTSSTTSGSRSIAAGTAPRLPRRRLSSSPTRGSNPAFPSRQADADVKRVAADIARTGSRLASCAIRRDSTRLRAIVVTGVRPTLLMLLAAAALLFFCHLRQRCSALLLARSVARAPATLRSASRSAPVAGTWRCSSSSKGLFVSLTGPRSACSSASWLVQIVVSMAADFVPRADEIALDWRVLLVRARRRPSCRARSRA